MRIGAGARVALDYRILDEGGNVVESSEEDGAISYVHGTQDILPGLEAALDGASAGDRRTVALEPGEAFGAYDPGGIVSVPRAEFPAEAEFARGDWIEVHVADDEEAEADLDDDTSMEMRVVEVHADEILLDANHPLAGKRVTFEVVVVSVEAGA